MVKNIILISLMLLFLGLLCAQTFDIKAFSDTTKYGWKDWRDRGFYRQDLSDRQDLLQMYEIEANPIQTTILKSVAVPGFGQITSKAGTKGSVFLGGEILALGVSLFFYQNSLYYYQKYLDATQIEDIESYYKQAQGPRSYSMLFLALGFVIWAYNVFDVVQTTDEYNAKIWQEIMEKYGKKRVSMVPGGIQVQF
jgi:hypothetical protein